LVARVFWGVARVFGVIEGHSYKECTERLLGCCYLLARVFWGVARVFGVIVGHF